MRPRLLLLASSLLLACAACSQTAPQNATTSAPSTATEATDAREAAIDALFAEQAGAGNPGGAVGVYQDGRRVFAKGYGLADLEAGTPITPQTPFHVASVSKQFTAFAIALLASEGQVDLDGDIRSYLPYVPDFGHTITVRHLILHTSGLRDQWSLFGIGGQDMDGRLTQQQIVNMVARQQALNFPPGTEYLYCNTGYTLLAEIVHAVSGQTLREFTTERIFGPLGMERTFFFDDVTEVVPARAHAYAPRQDENGKDVGGWQRDLLNYDNAGATSLFTTVEDLTKWAGNFAHPTVGDAALIEQVTTNGTLDDGTPIDYGFALVRGELKGRATISHSGADAGFRAVFVHYPEHDFAVALTANTPFDLLAKVAAIADLYLPPVEQPEPVMPAEDTTTDLSRFAGVYVTPYATALRLQIGDDGLYHHGNWGEPRKLVLREDGRLDFGEPHLQAFKPVLDADGQVIALDETGSDEAPRQRLQRFEPFDVDAATLAGFSGDYHSEELDITYSVTVEGGMLKVRSLWTNRPVELRPVLPDRFESTTWGLGTIVFQRDGAGRIDGLLVHNGRARDIRLDRTGPARPPVPSASTLQ